MSKSTPRTLSDRLRPIALALVAIIAIAHADAPKAQTLGREVTLNIAAVVNEDLITVYDLAQRISLVIAFSNLPDTVQTRQRIAPSALRKLISEKIRMQEAKRLEIKIDDNEIDKRVAEIERGNGLPPGGLEKFFQSRNIDMETLRMQIRSDLTWIDVVNRLFRGLVSVSDREVDDEVAKIQANAGKTEYLLSEIFLAYDGKARADVMQAAERIRQQLVEGASWPQMAQNFSENASAQRDGDVGWNQIGILPPAVGTAVAGMSKGQLSNPISTDEGVYLMLLRDTRVAQGIPEASDEKVRVELHQLHLPVPPGSDAQAASTVMTRAQQLVSGIDNCPAFDAVANAQGSSLSGALGTFELGSLSPQIRSLVQSVPSGGMSQPMRTDNGVIIMMVCSRDTETAKDPMTMLRDEINRRLLNEQLNRLAEQHEDKLRRQAFIDIRI